MSLIFAVIGAAFIVCAFRLKGLPIMTATGLFVGCFFLALSASALDVPIGPGECYVDWDGRSNSTICD